MKSNVKKITWKKFGVFVIPKLVSDLDKSKCSHKFLENNLPNDTTVYVKCDVNGELDLRGKKEEYRIIPNIELEPQLK